MKIGLLLTVFFTGTWKFMFTPALAIELGFNFMEAWILSCSGALLSSIIFYWGADFFMIKAHQRKLKKTRIAKEKGLPVKQKKQFTRLNKMIVYLKNKIGWYGVSFFTPLFLSIPVGSIIVAKFYGKRSLTYPLLVFGLFANGLITTSIAYVVLA